MLEAFGIRTWEATIVILVGVFFWGLLRERARRKQKRAISGESLRLSRDLMVRASRAGYDTIREGIQTQNTLARQSFAPAGSYDSNPVLPLSGDPADPDDRYIIAALGMESNRQDFYRQAWEASHNNEYTSVKPGSW